MSKSQLVPKGKLFLKLRGLFYVKMSARAVRKIISTNMSVLPRGYRYFVLMSACFYMQVINFYKRKTTVDSFFIFK